MSQSDSEWDAAKNDRRASARLVSPVKLSFSEHSESDSPEVINISANGLLCKLNREIDLMTKVELKLLLPPKDADSKNLPLTIRGVVVRSDKRGSDHLVAIYFADLSSATKKQLTDYLDDNGTPDIDQLR